MDLTQGHHIDIVVNDNIGGREPLLHGLDDWITIPARHDRGGDDGAIGKIDRTGDADPDPAQEIGIQAMLLEHFFQQGANSTEDLNGAFTHEGGLVMADEDFVGEIGHCQVDAGGADIYPGDVSESAVQAEGFCAPPAGIFGDPAFDNIFFLQ